MSGTAIVKIVQGDKTITLQCKLQRNLGTLDIVNTSDKPMKFNKNNAIGIVDIRSLGFYNIRHSTLQYNLSMQLPQFNRMMHRHDQELKHDQQSRPKQQQSGRDGKQSQHAKHDEESRSADPYP